ncbi:hypothetical protein WUBG_19133 [Wuchereria bancrofti]|uniref:Uncharacterized protein n=1 Tax=Wuchereria bancrofti TaxID=6293 RepID=J9DK20_WUCBA|nr:hypothetical protein WUBG_19133 [Wuchereria bancrofti]
MLITLLIAFYLRFYGLFHSVEKLKRYHKDYQNMAAIVDLLNWDAYTEHIFCSNRLKSFTKNAWPHQQSVNYHQKKVLVTRSISLNKIIY